MTLRRDHSGTAAIVMALLLAGACSGGGNEDADAVAEDEARAPADRLEALLKQSPDSGTVVPLMTGDTLRISAPTLAFYRRLRYRPAWSEDGELREQARLLYGAVLRAPDDGLSPARYRVEAMEKLLATLEPEKDADGGLDEHARASYQADLDLLLSEGFMRLATDLVRGTIPPEAVGRAWRIKRNAPPTEAVLRSAMRGGDPAQIVDRLRPTTPNYRRMLAALAGLRQVREAGGWTQLPEGLSVAEGDSSQGVGLLRQRLSASDDAREAALARVGAARAHVYDRDLRDALRHFQERHGLDDDGQLGEGTVRELNHPVEERIAEVRLNLDRWRWLPQNLGELFVLVNIAGFELEVVENNRTIEAMNVVVGKAGWTTPVFADTMKHLVLNPYWTPPPSIMEEEILPAIARDPGYLARNNFERTRDGGVRQRPGGKNALGRYKFLFPNADNIYLHDTPADHLFSRARRDFSHGCIRLERPADLARLVVARSTSHSPTSIDAMLATGSEKWVNLKRPIPIYIVYFTAWVKEDGTLRFYHDVYGHDEAVESELPDLDDVAPVQRIATAR